MLNVYIAQPHGFCFGIDRAIELAQKTAQQYQKNIYFLGELVHNQHVVDWLKSDLKIKTVQSLNEIPANSIVIIRAHGAAPAVYQQALAKGLDIVDASCPLVLKSHLSAINFTRQGKKVIFICNKIDHDETVGVVGENPLQIFPVVINAIADFDIPDPQNYVVMTQTTLSTLETKNALELLKNKYPQITIMPHICQATTDRQNAVIELAKSCSLAIIVGSPTSANSHSLKQVAQSVGVTAYIVDNASEVNPVWFTGHQNIAVSSGASTPEDVFEKVIQTIKSF